MLLVRVLLLAVVLGFAAAQNTAARVIVIGNFGPDVNASNTLPSPSLPSGSYLPSQAAWQNAFNVAISSFIGSTSVLYNFASIAPPIVVQTKGSVSAAIVGLQSAIVGMPQPDVVIVSDGQEVSSAVQKAVVERFGTSVLILMARASSGSPNFADPTNWPSTLRVVPSDVSAAKAAAAALSVFSWQALSIISSSDDYGDSFSAAFDAAFVGQQKPPRVLGRERLGSWISQSRDGDDVNAVTRISAAGAVGVLVVGGPGFAARVLSAVARARATAPAVDNLFFLFTSESFPDFPVTDRTNFAVLTPSFLKRTSFQESLVQASLAVGDAFAYQLSYILDAIAIVAQGTDTVNRVSGSISGQTLLAAALTNTVGANAAFTGSISFSRTTNNRDQCDFVVLRTATSPINGDSQRIATINPCSAASALLTANIVPASRQQVVQVCLVSSDTCADYANVNHALLALLDANSATPVDKTGPTLPNGLRILPVALAAGTTGVRAIAAVSKNAPYCDFLLGPSRTTLTLAINPLTTYNKLPTIDFGSTASALTDRVTYPYFSRTVPNDLTLSKAYASTLKYFGWDSVTIITSQDSYGTGVGAQYTKAMADVATGVEKIYYIDPQDFTNTSIVAALKDISANLITRVVLVALPASDAQLRMTFATIDALGMRASHLWIFSDTVCQFTGLNPSFRSGLIGSICLEPQFSSASAGVFNSLLTANGAAAKTTLATGGYDTVNCDGTYSDLYSPFAHDAAWTIVDTIRRLVATNNGSVALAAAPTLTVFSDGSTVVDSLRKSSFAGYSGAVEFDVNGDRKNAAFNIRIQQPAGVITMGRWTEANGLDPNRSIILTWADNSTTVPRATTRSVAFIAAKTAEANPAIIVVSVLGFALTIGLMVFCFKYQKMKQQNQEAGVQFAMAGHSGDRESKETIIGALTQRPTAPAAPVEYDATGPNAA